MASGDSLLQWTAYHNEPPATAYATLDTRNQHPVLDFDADTDESAVFSGVMPQHYAGTTGVTVLIHYAMTSAEANEVVWNAAFELVGDQQLDIDGDDFAAANATTVTVPGTSGLVDIASITFTDGVDMDSVAAGDGFRLKITRDADNGDDDATGDAELRWLELRET